MRFKQIAVYTYEELSEAAKEHARHKHNELDTWIITERLKDIATEAGFSDAEVYWSLSCCQGDGACFVGEWRGKELEAIVSKAFKGEIPRNVKRILKLVSSYKLDHSGRYYHSNSVAGTVYLDYDRDFVTRAAEFAYQDLCETLEDYREEVCREMEKDGYADIEYYLSDEYFAEMCENNEWEFDAEGDMI